MADAAAIASLLSGVGNAGKLSQSYSNSKSNGSSWNSSSNYSYTDGTSASNLSKIFADQANQQALYNWFLNAEYNSAEAAKTREYNAEMANTTVQRTVNDLINAGINPILAASAGFSADSYNSSATASNTSAGSYMATATPNSISVGSGAGGSAESSVSKSESGQLTAASKLIDYAQNKAKEIASAAKVKNADKSTKSAFNYATQKEIQTFQKNNQYLNK